ncbi:MAG: hypothetical protein A2V93_02515 [Ignavibacteria bacterium RBG_16_34_14]|nr:MAG: hypothetical protein A2V93_02515 [Ignavibacteria bacterium RBG_16_34_14]
MWKLTITNSFYPQEVYLHGTIESISSGDLLAEARSASFSLPAGIKRITSADINPIDLTKYSDEVDRTLDKLGTLPNGEYRICIYVISSGTNEIIGSSCNDVSVLTITQPELLSPMDGETILEFLPAFTWLSSASLLSGSEITYELNIAEILERQTPEYTILSNPSWFVQKNIRNNLFQYPSGAIPMVTGQRYAWQLKTFVDGILLSESEIREFIYENISLNIYENNTKIKEQIEEELKGKSEFGEEFPSRKDGTNNNISFSEEHFNELPSGLTDLFQLTRPEKNPLVSSSDELLISNFDQYTLPDIIAEPLEEIKPFEFLGSYSLDYQYSNRKGIGSEIPKNYLNLHIDPTILIYSIPLSVNLLYSTQQQKDRQNINSISLLLDTRYLKKIGEEKANEKIIEMQEEVSLKENELEQNKDKLSDEEIEKLNSEIKLTQENIEDLKRNPENTLAGSQGFFSSFKSLGFGMNYPHYTKYTLDGARVTGLNLEMNPGWFYFAFTGWDNLEAVPGSSFSRNLLAGRIGAGSTDDTHFHLTLMKAYDNKNSLTANEIPEFLTPAENVVFGADLAFNLFDDLFKAGGEFAASMFTRDVNSPELTSDDIPEFVKRISNVRMSSQLDFMYEFFSDINIRDTDTKLKSSYRMVGPGYISLGAPGIRRDISGFDIKLNQILFNRVLNLTVQFAREQNNLIAQSNSTSTYYKYGFNLKMNFKDAPYLIIDYRPNFVSNDLKEDSLKIKYNTHIFSLMTGLNVFGDFLTSSTNFVFLVQSSTSNIGTNDLSLFNFTLSENLSFTFPLSITGSLGFIKYNPAEYTTIILDFSAGYTFFNLWRNSIGLNYASESERSKKTGIYFMSGITVWEIGNLFINLSQTFYREDFMIYGDRDEFIFRAGLSKSINY